MSRADMHVSEPVGGPLGAVGPKLSRSCKRRFGVRPRRSLCSWSVTPPRRVDPCARISSVHMSPRSLLVFVALVSTLALAGCAHPNTSSSGLQHPPAGLAGIGALPEPASGWPAAQFDARHSSATGAVGPQHAEVRWTSHINGDLTPGPVIGVEGSVLQASHAGTLTAIDPATGRTRWTFDGGSAYGSDLSTSPSVLASGLILWPGPNSTLFAITASGQLAWEERFSDQVLSPAVAGRNRVYAADLSGQVKALVVTAQTHRTAWTLELHSTDYASPAVSPDGTITTATARALVGIHDLGDRAVIAWTFRVKRMIEVSSGVSDRGVVVLGTNHDLEFGVDADGARKWGLQLGDYTYSSSTVRPDGTAYFADNSGRVWVVDSSTGRVLHRVQPKRAHAWTSVVADSRGDFYWATMTGHVYGYAASGSQLFDLPIGAGSDSYPAIGEDGTLYIATTDGRLLAIRG